MFRMKPLGHKVLRELKNQGSPLTSSQEVEDYLTNTKDDENDVQ